MCGWQRARISGSHCVVLTTTQRVCALCVFQQTWWCVCVCVCVCVVMVCAGHCAFALFELLVLWGAPRRHTGASCQPRWHLPVWVVCAQPVHPLHRSHLCTTVTLQIPPQCGVLQCNQVIACMCLELSACIVQGTVPLVPSAKAKVQQQLWLHTVEGHCGIH